MSESAAVAATSPMMPAGIAERGGDSHTGANAMVGRPSAIFIASIAGDSSLFRAQIVPSVHGYNAPPGPSSTTRLAKRLGHFNWGLWTMH